MGDKQVSQLELSIENKGFSYDEEKTRENVSTHEDRVSINTTKPNRGLNYDPRPRRIIWEVCYFNHFLMINLHSYLEYLYCTPPPLHSVPVLYF